MAVASKKTEEAQAESRMVAEFREEYAEIEERIRIAMETTDSEAWEAMYRTFIDANKKQREANAATLRSISETLQRKHLDEDDEKILGECRRNIIESRERFDHFMESTVNPVIGPVLEANALIEKFIEKSINDASQSPLINADLPEQMREAVEGATRYKFNWMTGMIDEE